jgi:hypothetical protein
VPHHGSIISDVVRAIRAGLRSRAPGKECEMIRSFIPLLFCAIIGAASFTEVLARDNLPIGYTAVTGIKAGLWVAEEGGIF